MEIRQLPFSQVPYLSKRDQSYTMGAPELRPFYRYDTERSSFAQAIEDKKKDNTDRKTLVETLREQYSNLETSQPVKDNIESLLKENTFTLVTAHQPSLFTGPLYYIYKIISTINLAETLREQYPGYNFVPVFISGGEDHDFEEVNHLHLFGKSITWENEESGPVGTMKTDTLQPVLEEVREVLGNSERAEELYALLRESVEGHSRYADTARHLANALFKDYGLVIIDMSDARLKKLFVPFIKEEILNQPSKALVEATVARLEEAGFSEQAYPREINFFYLGPELRLRERIVLEDGTYKVLNTDYAFREEELVAEIEKHPERFSPNVVMRPIYQELVLPNLAYIGGGGELAYWLERKSQFEHFGINYPMLVRRNSVLFIDQGNAKRMEKLELSVEQLFGDIEALIKEYVRENTENEISLADEKAQLNALVKGIEEKAREVDPTLVKTAAAEGQKMVNSLEQLESKLMRAEKQRHDIAINQMRTLKDKLFPGNGLQERYDNFMMYYLKYGQEFFDILKKELDPMDKRFTVIIDR
ncbi:MAG: bacillithiol biosynthesis cysteine-adding enzyme BshC [Phaeodactylibacter sp.]|nr:bacillithiol biosynthesis cysteine-adding enzyme BshC [Phaeodactylibacter sp.]MCB9265339.1 bacillithiol biosynthesis cysteine-adding enzyme BshC [Lewinellaceae bacterium]MCB9288561.1 bacillithiol biosynthesis cysteine-adding enzyme BshC [Lewinellaceae bacterium]